MQVALVRPHHWFFVCPCCGKLTAALYPAPGSGRGAVQAALEVEWSRRNERGEVALPDLRGDFGWACQTCRTGKAGSEASRMGRVDRLLRAAAKADDPKRGQRRWGESWDQEARRERRIDKAHQRLGEVIAREVGWMATFTGG